MPALSPSQATCGGGTPLRDSSGENDEKIAVDPFAFQRVFRAERVCSGGPSPPPAMPSQPASLVEFSVGCSDRLGRSLVRHPGVDRRLEADPRASCRLAGWRPRGVAGRRGLRLDPAGARRQRSGADLLVAGSRKLGGHLHPASRQTSGAHPVAVGSHSPGADLAVGSRKRAADLAPGARRGGGLPDRSPVSGAVGRGVRAETLGPSLDLNPLVASCRLTSLGAARDGFLASAHASFWPFSLPFCRPSSPAWRPATANAWRRTDSSASCAATR